jgi:hypothetical protein
VRVLKSRPPRSPAATPYGSREEPEATDRGDVTSRGCAIGVGQVAEGRLGELVDEEQRKKKK